jgi:hypothetical protein
MEDTPRKMIKGFICSENAATGAPPQTNNAPPTGKVQFNNPQMINTKAPITQGAVIANKFHREILQNPAFENCGPSIVDSVFSLDKYTREDDNIVPQNSQVINEEVQSQDVYLRYEECKDSKYSASEICLIVLNVFLFVGILVTVLSSVLLYLVVNREPR